MKRNLTSALTLVLTISMLLCLAACADQGDSGDLWDSAVYHEDTEFGTGAKTLTVEVKVEDRSVTFTVHTDKDTVGAALLEHKLIEGDDGQYGMYIKSVNGIRADYSKDKAYWAFYIGEEYALTGVDATVIDTEAKYRLEYAK